MEKGAELAGANVRVFVEEGMSRLCFYALARPSSGVRRNSPAVAVCPQGLRIETVAFVADYVRLYALHKYGGIYLDTDVQLLKNFDAFLNDGFFVSVEGDIREGENIPEPAVMAACPDIRCWKKQ